MLWGPEAERYYRELPHIVHPSWLQVNMGAASFAKRAQQFLHVLTG